MNKVTMSEKQASLEDTVKALLEDPVTEKVDEPLSESFIRKGEYRSVVDDVESQTERLVLSEDQKRARVIYQALLMRAADESFALEEQAEHAAHIEGGHIWTKMLDDLEDDDDTRNLEKTIHRMLEDKIGEESDFTKFLTLNHLLCLRSRNYRIVRDSDYLSDSKKLEVLDVLWKAEERLARGQNFDLLSTRIAENPELQEKLALDDELDIEDLLMETNRLKTSSLFKASVETVESITERELPEVERSAVKTGQAFQIWDDVLDIRRERYSDLEETNYTIPILYAQRELLNSDSQKKKERGKELKSLLAQDETSPEEREKAADIIRSTPALEQAEKKCRELIEEANRLLETPEWENHENIRQLKAFNKALGYKRPK